MKNCKIFKKDYRWIVVVRNDSMGNCIENVIRQNKLPYIDGATYRGDYAEKLCGGLNVEIHISVMVEECDLKELELIINEAANGNVIKNTKYRKKLTTFTPSHSWSSS